MRTNLKSAVAVVSLIGAVSAHAASIAIIDSGWDLKHSAFQGKIWDNPNDPDDAVDNDDNGYIDDIHGWNFAENNDKLIDYRYLGKFSADVNLFFEKQLKTILDTATEEDKEWIKSKKEDKKFISELSVFGNFVHGTHVAGIAAKDAPEAKIIGIKLLPTKMPGQWSPERATRGKFSEKIADYIIRTGISALAKQQGKSLDPIGAYLADIQPKVANCSFGTSVPQLKGLLKPLIEMVLMRKATDEEVTKYASLLVSQVVDGMSGFAFTARKTLLVIAAGNDGSDNDVLPTSPANVKAENTITVAATAGLSKLAKFSNYGKTMVEVAAPGVGILSAVPGNEMLRVSGTSQAAPFVTNVAGRIWDANPSLRIAEVKRILMETVDFKDFLRDKVVAGGIVNPDRAVRAALLSKGSVGLSKAIDLARMEVKDMEETTRALDTPVIPLFSLFQ